MKKELSQDSLARLFGYLLQHMKCMEVRLDYARCGLSTTKKLTINQAMTKVRTAIDHLCGLLPDGESVAQIKKELDKVDLVYVMTLTEQLCQMDGPTLEEVTELIDRFLEEKKQHHETIDVVPAERTQDGAHA